jgi:8-oxo-dGTP diphosphatase
MADGESDGDGDGDGDGDFRPPHLRHTDFLGAFAVLEAAAGILMVQNRRWIHGAEVLTWDLPGGEVEAGEVLGVALRRELDEETGLQVVGPTPFLFVQEGVRSRAGRAEYAWRSFFFAVAGWQGEPAARSEVLAVAWIPRAEMRARLRAPYHDSFLTWLETGGRFFTSSWAD